MRALVWFRSDLRARDNTALFRAMERCAASKAPGAGAIGLWVISPGEWRSHDMSAVQADLRLRCAHELSRVLDTLGVPLLCIRVEDDAKVPEEVLRIAREHRCAEIHFNKEYEIDERRRDDRLVELARESSVRVIAHTDQSLVEPGEVRTGEGRYFTVFSPFKRALYAHMLKGNLPAELPLPRKQEPTGVASSALPERIEGYESRLAPNLWPAGEAHAAKRLETFLQSSIDAYKARRDFPGVDGTSALSPYLAVGAISPRQCLHGALRANESLGHKATGSKSLLDHGSEGVVHWISEVVWREFYIHILVGYPRVSMGRAFQPKTERVRWNDNDEHFRAWCEGRTGVPIVDAAMRQLHARGWMHNRLRMIAAMYLSKNLLLDWRLGERYFAQHLVDFFLASNNGGWQWSASTGTDAAPYFRIFNPVSQSEKFDESGEFIREYVPELRDIEGPAIHAPWELPSLLRGRLDYPEPIVDLSATRQRAIDAFKALG